MRVLIPINHGRFFGHFAIIRILSYLAQAHLLEWIEDTSGGCEESYANLFGAIQIYLDMSLWLATLDGSLIYIVFEALE